MVIEKTYDEAVGLLRGLSTKDGFLASDVNEANYRRIWSRDGVIEGLACMLTGDKDLIKTFRKTLDTLKKFQDDTGRIVSNVDLNNNRISYGTLVGKVDATIWYIIGVGQYYKYTKDVKFLKNFYDSSKKSLDYLESLELNGRGFVFVPTGGNWADEYVTHGYTLFDQLLYLQALKDFDFMSRKINKSNKKIKDKIVKLEKMISVNYFKGENPKGKYIFNETLYRRIDKKYKGKYALASFSSDGFIDNMDGFSNSLLLILDVLNKSKNNDIMKCLNDRLSKQKLKIVPAFWPPIKDGKYFDVLKMNFLFKFKNKPHYSHNGGLWPVIQGFFIAGLVKQGKRDLAAKYLEEFSQILANDNYDFDEFYDSKNYRPGGTKKLGFSASGFIIAYKAVKEGELAIK